VQPKVDLHHPVYMQAFVESLGNASPIFSIIAVTCDASLVNSSAQTCRVSIYVAVFVGRYSRSICKRYEYWPKCAM